MWHPFRLHLLIRLRWLAAGGLLAAVLVGAGIFGLPLAATRLYVIAGVLLLYNSGFWLLMRRQRSGDASGLAAEPAPGGAGIANAQIALDLTLLTVLLHSAGGLANPFVLFYVFHMVFATILLSRRAALLQATLAAGLAVALGVVDAAGVLPPQPLYNAATPRWAPTVGAVVALVISVYVVVAFTDAIVARLRKRERDLADKDRAMAEYLTTVSHDLRGSLAAIESSVRVVHDGATGSQTPQAADMLGRALRRTQALTRFVSDLVTVARLRAGTETPPRGVDQELDAGRVAEQMVDQLQPLADEGGVRLSLTVDGGPLPAVRADAEEVDHLLGNLIGNAIAYTPRGGEVRVTAAPVGRGAGLLFTVADSGIGIPREAQAHIFDELYRAPNAREHSPVGSGLGLAIAKRIVDRLGGQIEVESEEGVGTTFTVTLPAARP